MEAGSWDICPVLFIPAALLWACINAFCDKIQLSKHFANKFGWKKNNVQKWQEIVTGAIALALTFAIIVVISHLIGFDLVNWEWFDNGTA